MLKQKEIIFETSNPEIDPKIYLLLEGTVGIQTKTNCYTNLTSHDDITYTYKVFYINAYFIIDT